MFGKSKSDDAALAARYKRLLAVGKALASERDLKKVLAQTMDAIVELANAERAFVWLGTAEEGAVAVARNLDKEHVRKPAGKLSLFGEKRLRLFQRVFPFFAVIRRVDDLAVAESEPPRNRPWEIPSAVAEREVMVAEAVLEALKDFAARAAHLI